VGRVADRVGRRGARRFVATAVQRLVGVVTLLVVAGVVLAPRMSNNRYDATQVAAALAVVVACWTLWVLVPNGVLRRGRRVPDRAWDVVAAVVCAAGTGGAALAAHGSVHRLTWDPRDVRLASATPPAEFPEALVQYFSRYPNMLPLLAVARTLRSWGARLGVTDYDTLFGVLNAGALLVTALALYLTIRTVRGAAWGVLGLLLVFALLGTSPWLAVPYTDMLALWTPMTALALFGVGLRRRPWRHLVPVAAGGAVLGVGATVKVTPAVGLVALLLTLALAAPAHRGEAAAGGGPGARPRRWRATGAVVAVAGFVVAGLAAGAWAREYARTPPLIPDRAATPLTYLASGVRVQHDNPVAVTYGAYDAVVWHRTKDRDRATQDRVARELIRAAWDDRGPAGMAGFAVEKTLFNWGDGMFWAWGEGTDAKQVPPRRGPVADAVGAWNRPGGDHFATRVAAAQVTWLAVLLGMGAGLALSRYRPELLLAALTVAGIAVFALVFQGRSRYLIGHVPVVVALASCVVPAPRRRRPVQPDPAAPAAPAESVESAEPAASAEERLEPLPTA
jgi:hypothetical protein